MQHVGSIARQLPIAYEFDFKLSKHKRKRIESCELVRELREEQRQDLAFHSRPFVLCGLPIRRPKAGTLKYTRRNGRFVLEIVGHPDFGLPFGQDRLIPLWVATLAVRQKSKTILFRSAAEILEEFDLPRDARTTVVLWTDLNGSLRAPSTLARRRRRLGISSGITGAFISLIG